MFHSIFSPVLVTGHGQPCTSILSLLMSVEGNIEPRDKRCHPGVASWEGGRTVSETKTVHILKQSKIIALYKAFTSIKFFRSSSVFRQFHCHNVTRCR